MVELRTTYNTQYMTDSNGIVAYYEPGLMDREVFFFVESHGYEFPKDGFGYHGKRLKTSPGGSAVIKIDRHNIAERLYRITGQRRHDRITQEPSSQIPDSSRWDPVKQQFLSAGFRLDIHTIILSRSQVTVLLAQKTSANQHG